MSRGLGYVFVVALLVGQASADVKPLELFTVGSSGWINNAYFLQVDPKGTGTGKIDPFVRLEKRTAGGSSPAVVEGYNTDGRLDTSGHPAPFYAKKDAGYTHALLAGEASRVTMSDGKKYWKFGLDINQEGTASRLTLNELQIYRGGLALKNAVTETLSSDGTLTDLLPYLVWDLDAGPQADNQINLEAAIGASPGSGKGDMYAYIPVSGSGEYLLLYSQFGNGLAGLTNYINNDGFEEWGTVGHAPLPGAVLLGFLGLGTAGWRLRRFA